MFLQVDPLADCHIGPITGLAAAPDGAHISSCGSDGAVRVWAAASGHLVGKRDLGARLTCCAVALGSTAAAAASKPVLAVGSEGGVIRWVLCFCQSRNSKMIVHDTLDSVCSGCSQLGFHPAN